jgi:hypothetical protein
VVHEEKRYVKKPIKDGLKEILMGMELAMDPRQ